MKRKQVNIKVKMSFEITVMKDILYRASDDNIALFIG